MSNTVLPFSAAPTRMWGARPLPTLDPHNANISGPTVCYRNTSVVASGLLSGWDADAAHALVAVPKPLDAWDVSWSEADQYFVDNVHTCSTPEEVEGLLPVKWVAYKTSSASSTNGGGGGDEALGRVCALCTALVDKFIALSQDGASDQTTAKWRLHNALLRRLRAVMELLEASIGEAIPILKLKDAEFVRRCWQRLEDDDRHDVFSALSASAAVAA